MHRGGDTICKPPTVFHYREETGFTFGAEGLDIASAGQLDFNGDGIPDFMPTTVVVDPVEENFLLEASEVVTDIGVGIASSFMGPGGIA